MTAELHPQSKEISRRTIGPLDKRKITTRCQPCAKRRVKCDGGNPCERCARTRKACMPQESEQGRVKFVHASGHTLSCTIPMQVQKHEDTLYVDHFASFFEKCHFSAESATTNQNIVSIILKHPLLQHIAVAIGALDASRKASIRSTDKLQSPRHIAFRACGISLKELHSTITTVNSGFSEDVFWCSFLHGLFELMAENSGNSFAMHMVFGMSKALFQLKPTSPISPSMKTLIDAFWILEANRTILYGDNVTLDPGIYQLNSTQSWPDPMKQILILMIQTSTFAKRLFDEIESIPPELRPFDIRLDALALEGLEIKDRLLNWQWQSCLGWSQAGPFNDLAAMVHNALLLYHCRNFTYYSCWTTRAVPQLHQVEVDKHVAAILDLSQRLLSDTYVPAVLLLFPLRMAGAHVSEINAQNKVLGLLRKIRQKGFIVSDVIEVDLQQLWQLWQEDN